jgi:MULE transposase domain
MKDPEEDHHVDCRPVAEATIDVTEMDRAMRSDVHTTGKRPRDAYSDTVLSIAKRFKSTEEQAVVIEKFPTFSGVRRQLSRHRDALHVPVPDPFNIPDELRTTYRGKNVNETDINYLERFLLYSGQDGKLLVFCADSELRTLYNSTFIICDGTFEMAPSSSYQLYTMHGFHSGEAMPLMWAILPNKSGSTYAEMFGAIRQAMVDKHGDVGGQRCFLVDFELAAIDAIRTVFTESRVKGCTFHFRQALMRHVADEGLRPTYSSNDPPQVRDWIRQIMGLTLLPVVFIARAWDTLRCPPAVADPGLVSKMAAFSAYVDRTWINGSFNPAMWSHFDNIGPRTTNIAEGWHNKLNHSFGMPHPSPRNFLHWLQKCQFDVQCRLVQLDAGRVAKPRAATYIQLDDKIASAKLNFSLRAGNIFTTVFPHPNGWTKLGDEITTYLRHAAYLIAGQP